MLLEQKARQYATEAHKGQFRKDGITPYINHPGEVVNLLKSIGIKAIDTLCSGWLHDGPEDTKMTIELIEKEFNANIARIVGQLTRDVDREAYKERIRNADYAVQIVKLADVVHNCSDLKNPSLPAQTIRRKVEDCESLYLELAERICPEFHEMLVGYLASFRD